jgi:phage portal protein BeeE
MEKQNILQRIFGINKRAFIPTMVPVGNNFSFFGGANLANVTVSSESALKVSTFYSCVRSISEDIAKLPDRKSVV